MGQKQVKVYHYDAFTDIPGKGNPAGVVFDADAFTEEQMVQIARRVGFNETTFVQTSALGTLRLRYFTPGHEMNLCGHATVASLTALWERGVLEEDAEILVETKAGLLPMKLISSEKGVAIYMRQAAPEFISFEGDVGELMASIGLTTADWDEQYPIVYGSTGIWTLLIPIRTLEAFERMIPNNKTFPSILTQIPKASLHPFAAETIHPDCHMHARHFSSPYSGTIEDPVTGTASGVMGAYWLQYMHPKQASAEVWVEQGREVGKDGKVFVQAMRKNDIIEITISGTAVLTGELDIQYDD
ncbi:isomerase [Paenibacillus swuensis]|uniref:Isomerase n=1 Tax=Paenibacillus swuensis TaxID=1178515 RepID=A0A172TDS8_9BACL|nr:PhzF family phenazine biosynthesis isomerase [Paenibacillus swuensis]ANE45106.1 isomerase [Paenibacillus swuensis]